MKTVLFSDPRAENAEAETTLLCFPHAGGNVHTYLAWARWLPKSVAVFAYQAAGRGVRVKEAAAPSLAYMIDEIIEALVHLPRRRLVFCGHSFGGFLAFETMRRMRDQGVALPALFIASASLPPPAISNNRTQWDGITTDQAMFDALVEMGGISPELQGHAAAFLPMMPSVRAEYRFLTQYHYVFESPLQVALALFSGERDSLVPEERMVGWSALFEGLPTVKALPDGHFYVETQAELVCKHLSALLPTPAPSMA
jgi:surfactin synthase thioesterase subunit